MDGWLPGSLIACRIEVQLVVYQSVTNQLISAVLLTKEMLESQRASTVAFASQCWWESWKGYSVYSILSICCCFSLTFYCWLLLFVDCIISASQFYSHCYPHRIYRSPARCPHQSPSSPWAPEEWVKELGDALQWADLSMGKSRHMSWGLHRWTLLNIIEHEHYWTLLNTYVPIFLEKHLWPPEKPGQISWVFAARIGTWWSQLTQMMPFGNRAWPGNPRSIEVLNGAMA